MQRTRDQLFSRPGLAQNTDPRLARRHPVHLRHHALHAFARVDDFVFPHSLPQIPVLVLQPLQLEHVVHGQQQLVRGQRLLQKIDRAQAGRAHRHLDVRLPADHHHWQRDAQPAHFLEQREPVLARHHHVAQHHVEALPLHQLQGARGVVAHRGFVPGQPEGARQ